MIKGIIFDLDGTILNTLRDLHEAVNHSLNKYGYKLKELEDTKNNIGNGIRNLIIRSADNKLDDIDLIFNEFNQYYKVHYNDYTNEYDGITDLLVYLKNKGLKLVCCTNKINYAANGLIEAHFPNLFDLVVSDGMGITKKPDRAMIDYILNKLDLNNDEVIYIGDSDVDVKTINNSNIEGIIVSYGFRDKSILSNLYNNIIDSPKELKEYLIKRLK
jgi:phosphoglycolate phosphatase